MAKKRYFPDTIVKQILWLTNLKAKLPALAAKYGISVGDLADRLKDIDYIIFWFSVHNALEPVRKQVTAFWKELMHGVHAGHTASSEPDLSLPGPPPASVLPGALVRILAVCNAIKENTAYNTADGEALELEGVEKVFDPATAKPDLTGTHSPGGAGQLHATKGGSEGYEVWKNTPAGYAEFQRSTQADWIDPTPLPTFGEMRVDKYKARYIHKGQPVGQWSVEVTIIVYGVI